MGTPKHAFPQNKISNTGTKTEHATIGQVKFAKGFDRPISPRPLHPNRAGVEPRREQDSRANGRVSPGHPKSGGMVVHRSIGLERATKAPNMTPRMNNKCRPRMQAACIWYKRKLRDVTTVTDIDL